MKMKILVIFLILLSSLIEDSFASVKEPTDLERKKVALEWIHDAVVIVKKTRNQNIIKIVDNFKNNAVIFKFNSHNNVLSPLDNVPIMTKFQFRLLPVFSSDKRNAVIRSYTVNSAGKYIPWQRILVLDVSQPMTNAMKGLLIIHEGQHILQHYDESHSSETENDWCEKEYEAFKAESLALRLIGGKKYRDLINKSAQKIVDENRIKGDFQVTNNYDLHIDDIFGKPLSGNEKGFRMTGFSVDILQTAFDSMYPPGPEHVSHVLKHVCEYYKTLLGYGSSIFKVDK